VTSMLDWRITLILKAQKLSREDCSSLKISHDLSSSRREPDWFLSNVLFF